MTTAAHNGGGSQHADPEDTFSLLPSSSTSKVLPPSLNLANLNVSAIADPAIVALIEQERLLREEIDDLKSKVRRLSLDKQAQVGRTVVETDRGVSQFNDRVDALAQERATVARQLEEVRFKQAALATARDGIVSAEHQRDAATQALLQHRGDVDDIRKRVATLEGNHRRMAAGMRFTTVAQVDGEIARLTGILAGLPKGRAPPTTIVKEKAHAEQSKRDVAGLQDVAEKIARERRVLQQAEDAIGKWTAAREEAERKRADTHTILAQGPALRSEYDALRRRQAALQRDIDELLKQRRARKGKPASTAVSALNTALDECRQAQQDKEGALRSVQQRLPYRSFRFKGDFRKSLVGAGGGVIRDLETDFGVAIQLDKAVAYVIGGADECAQCIEAMRAVLLDAESRGHRATVPIAQAQRPIVIGKNGTTIDRVQSASGAKVVLSSDSVVVTGTAEEVEAATALLRDILDRNARAVVPLDASMLDAVIGKRGATIRRTMEETGVDNIHVDRKASAIVITGPKDAVAAAADAYKTLFEGGRRDMVAVPCPKESRAAVIGKGGSVIRAIEASTGARIDVRGETIFITAATEEDLESAAAQVRDIVEGQRGQEKVPLGGMSIALLTTVAAGDEPSPLRRIQEAHGLAVAQVLRAESCVVLRGTPDAARRAKEELEAWLATAAADADTLTVPAPLTQKAKTAAARAGGGIGKVSLATGRIRVAGSAEVRAACAEAVRALCAEYADYIAEVEVPASRIGSVIGTRGVILRGIEEQTRTTITVDRKRMCATVVSIRKSEKDVHDAVAQVAAARDRGGQTGRGAAGSGDGARAPAATVEGHIPQPCTGEADPPAIERHIPQPCTGEANPPAVEAEGATEGAGH